MFKEEHMIRLKKKAWMNIIKDPSREAKQERNGIADKKIWLLFRVYVFIANAFEKFNPPFGIDIKTDAMNVNYILGRFAYRIVILFVPFLRSYAPHKSLCHTVR